MAFLLLHNYTDFILIVDTLAIWNKSRVGLMITPPPIPQIAPAVDARKLTKNAKIDIL